jgi:hypothetical protein
MDKQEININDKIDEIDEIDEIEGELSEEDELENIISEHLFELNLMLQSVMYYNK